MFQNLARLSCGERAVGAQATWFARVVIHSPANWVRCSLIALRFSCSLLIYL
jgi:hypothetical protein